jgi:nucleotide-binding universal stress UspA family protein
MSEHTVLAWDGTEPGSAALDWAIEREFGRNGTVDLVHIVDDTTVASDYLATEALLARAHDRIDAEALRIHHRAPHLTLNTHILRGDPYDELLKFTRPDAVLVVGTGRRRGLRSRYGWSLGARLAAGAHGPVVVVPVDASDRERSGVYVGIDGTHTGDLALGFAAREAERRGETLHVVHAWMEPLRWQQGAVLDEDLVDSLEAAHRSVLGQALMIVEKSHPSVAFSAHLVREDPALALLDLAESATLLVVGSRQRHGLSRAWMGSVSHTVILEIVGPTAVIAPEEEASEEQAPEAHE